MITLKRLKAMQICMKQLSAKSRNRNADDLERVRSVGLAMPRLLWD
jgi:hypothetical protein